VDPHAALADGRRCAEQTAIDRPVQALRRTIGDRSLARGLDAATERIAQAFPAACRIASVHRLSVPERFDRVVSMEAGRVVAQVRPDPPDKHANPSRPEPPP
jgi:hypothetical protein